MPGIYERQYNQLDNSDTHISARPGCSAADNIYVSLEQATPTVHEPREPLDGNTAVAMEKLEANIGIVLDVRATHKEYARTEAREQSFKKVKTRNGHSVEDLAKSGLFRTKHGETKCFHCGYVIEVPKERDIWIFHARTSPYCAHIRQCKGDMFVKSALVNEANVVSEGATGSSVDDALEHAKRTVAEVGMNMNRPQVREAIENNRLLSENLLCKICFDSVANIIVIPCGHLASCAQCFPALTLCPICRSEVNGTVRAQFVDTCKHEDLHIEFLNE